MEKQLKDKWTKIASDLLVGRTITKVRYMSKKECEDCYWDSAAIEIILDNGLVISPMSDEEANGPGALMVSDPKQPILPTI